VKLRLGRFELDRTTASVLGYRSWQVLQGTVTIVLVLAKLSANEQGFYYTFQNIPALQVLAELGLTFVLTQFASHEFAALRFTDRGTLDGDFRAKARLASLLRSAIGWFLRAASVTLVVALAAGYVIFTRDTARATGVSWQSAFFLLVLTNAALLCLAPLFAILDGVGLLYETTRIRFAMDVAAGVGLWVTLSLGAGLHALWVYGGLRLVVGALWLWSTRRDTFLDLASCRIEGVGIDWRREVWPFHWRMAVSSVSGFFMAQTLNPIIFATMGPTAAGQFGLTLSLTGAILTVAMSFVYARAPGFGALVAAGKSSELRAVWSSALRKSLGIAVLGFGGLILGFVAVTYARPSIAGRLLPLSCLVMMCMAQSATLCGSGVALYVRAHKKEPLLGVSVCMALAIPVAGFLAARAGSLLWLTASYALIFVVFMGLWPWRILAKFRDELSRVPEGPPRLSESA
jgi:hypothetical protein